MINVSIIGTVGLPACYGGFESLVENLTLNCGRNINYTVYCSSPSYSQHLEEVNGAKLVYIPLKANGVQSVFYDIVSLAYSLFRKPDVVLLLGVSGCLFLPFYRFFSNSRIVTNIDGLEWRRDKWGWFARKFLKFSESIAIKYSDVVVTDNKAISEYVSAEYGISSSTISYGGDHAIRSVKFDPMDEKFALGLCRIEPENNVEMILDAFSNSDMKLKFIGNWNSSSYGKRLFSKYENHDNIVLLDPIYDLDELFKLRSNCSLYIHGHSAGGTNPSLVEMMHFGIPIFAYDCNFNRFSTDNRASYFLDKGQLSLMLKQRDSHELLINGESMKEIASSLYTWKKISSEYEITYTQDA
tara:strand:+ start:6351 stop:7415 length:1065 start_codon:yes stop_codon:yes gene_type:complete